MADSQEHFHHHVQTGMHTSVNQKLIAGDLHPNCRLHTVGVFIGPIDWAN